jgi:hypothetical protein
VNEISVFGVGVYSEALAHIWELTFRQLESEIAFIVLPESRNSVLFHIAMA